MLYLKKIKSGLVQAKLSIIYNSTLKLLKIVVESNTWVFNSAFN